MDISKTVKAYILEDEFKITILENRVNIVNYTSIGHFDDEKVIVWKDNRCIVVKGQKLTISKLLHDEILITGILKEIALAE